VFATVDNAPGCSRKPGAFEAEDCHVCVDEPLRKALLINALFCCEESFKGALET
jgi:hypothetical protein